MTKQNKAPHKAMILAAGLGTRMRPLTLNTPKPLIKVHGKTLLDYGLDAAINTGVKQAIVNVHYLANHIEEHLLARQNLEIKISDERNELLDSGGGIVKALTHLGEDPFYLLNADSFWVDDDKPNLHNMATHWDPGRMDVLLLLADMTQAIGFSGKGDFFLNANGGLKRRGKAKSAPFAYAGAAILSPEIFENAPKGPFSLNKIFDKALEQDRLHGVPLDGLWLHVGTPEAIDEAASAILKFRSSVST